MFDIPEKLEEWEISTINELVKYSSIESERLDLKSEINDLQNHISAMANSSGGFLILGIKELKSENGKVILGYEKIGFKKGEEDLISKQIGNGIFEIEPTPSVKIRHIPDNNKFYSVIKVEKEISKKPFMIKNKGQFYIRIDSSTRPANRSTILNLFAISLEQKRTIEQLLAGINLVRESFLHAINDVRIVSPPSSMKIPPLDLSFFRNAVLNSSWFLTEKNLFGEHNNQGGYTHGINSLLHDLEFFNIYINSFNLSSDPKEREQLKQQLEPWRMGGSYVENLSTLLNKVEKECNEFLVKFDK